MDSTTPSLPGDPVVETVLASEVEPSSIGWHNVEEIDGVQTSILGMIIVFTGLVTTVCWILLLPKIAKLRRKEKPRKIPETVAIPKSGPEDAIDPELQAAIAYVIAAEHEFERMTDYTKMTIRRDANQQVWGVAGKMRSLANRKL